MCSLPAIGLDTETYYKKGEYDVKRYGYWKYCRDPRFDCYLLSVSDGAENWVGHPRDFNFNALKGRIVVSHVKAFDSEVALAEQERGRWPKIECEAWYCTADLSAYTYGVRSLKEASKLILGVEVSKAVRDRASGKTWDDMVREGWAQDMLSYGGLDPQLSVQIWNKVGHVWPEWERELSQLNILQGRNGVAIDTFELERGIRLLNRTIFNAQNNLPWVQRGRKPGSTIGVAEECRAAGIPCPPMKKDDPDAAAEWEETYAPRFPFVMALRNLRKAKKSVATLNTIKLRLRDDGTVAFSLKYAGAHTLRAAGDSGWNMQNMNKEPFIFDAKGDFVFDRLTVKGCIKLWKDAKPLGNDMEAFDMRGLVIPREGKKLCCPDLSQIEPRVLNYLAGNFELLDMVAKGMSIYEAHARATMGWTGGVLKDEDENLYNLAKVRVLALGYGCGYLKLIKIAAGEQYDIDLTIGDEEVALKSAYDGRIYTRYRVGDAWHYPQELATWLGKNACKNIEGRESERCLVLEKQTRKGPKLIVVPVYGMRARMIVEDFRRTNPKITALWERMEEGLRASVGGDYVVEGPHGGCLRYRDVRFSKRVEVDEETGEEYERKVLTAVVGGKRVMTYGGKLAENLIQWCARCCFFQNSLKLHRAGFPSLFSVHDEAVMEVSPDVDLKQIKALMSSTPEWLPSCPISSSVNLIDRYKK